MSSANEFSKPTERPPERNPAIPEPLPVPRDFPALSRKERSHAFHEVLSERLRVFTYALTILFLPLVLPDQLPLRLDHARTWLLAAACSLLGYVIASPQESLRRWANAAACCFSLLTALAVVCISPPLSAAALPRLLIAQAVAGAVFVGVPAFLAAQALCTLVFVTLALKQPPELLGMYWLQWVSAAGISVLLHVLQRRNANRLNELGLREEARLNCYNQAVQQLQQSEDRFKQLSNAAREALIVHADGKVLDANFSAGHLLGYGPGELIGRPVAELLDKRFARFTEQIMDPDNSSLVRIEASRKDGTLLEVMAFNHVLMLRNRSASVLGLRKVDRYPNNDTAHWFRDISRN